MQHQEHNQPNMSSDNPLAGSAFEHRQERRQVLELVAEGTISVGEALDILDALDTPKVVQAPVPPQPPQAPQAPQGKPAKAVHVVIQRPNAKAVNVTIPLQLAQFGFQFVPKDVRTQLAEQGIIIDQLSHLLAAGDLPQGRIVDLSNEEDGDVTRITVDVD